MIKNKLNYLLFLLFVLLPFVGAKAVGTDVSTNITSPVWTEANSPYVVKGTIEVTKGAVLKIEAGTEIKFATSSKIIVNGELQILGTAENPVILTSAASQPKAGDWGGIEFTSGAVDARVVDGEYVSGSIVRNAIIKFSSGIVCDDASPYLVGNQFSLNKVGVEIKGDDYSSGGLVMEASSANQNSSLVTIYLKNNTFSDNTLGVKIARNNGRNYVVTPAGYSYLGAKKITAYLSGNTINSNGSGVEILNGDNNYLIDNNLKYNFTSGIKIAENSRGNLVSRNTINNNNVGLESASASSLILQNNIKNNFSVGLKVTAKPTILALNNIHNNQVYNLDNRVYALSALNNYWGETEESLIEAGFRVTNSDVATGTAVMTYPVKFKPFLTSEATLKDLFDPIITTDLTSTNTVFSKWELAGIKPAGTAVYLGDTRIVPFSDELEWSYNVNLNLGANDLSISYRDKAGAVSESKSLTMFRVNLFASPTVTSAATTTSAETIILQGTKPAGSGLWLNEEQVMAIDQATIWSMSVTLKMGANKYSLVAKDGLGGVSSATEINVVRTGVPATSIVSEEKKLTTKADAKLASKLAGKLLLQVERAGFIWYINPSNNLRYFISQESALDIFRSLALGISEDNLKLIPTKESGEKGNVALRNRLKGKLLLRVGAQGQITYVDLDGYRHDISASNLMENFRKLSLGITNANLRKIMVGETKVNK